MSSRDKKARERARAIRLAESDPDLQAVARTLGLDKGLVTRWVRQARQEVAESMLPDGIDIVHYLLDDRARELLIPELEKEKGSILPIQNRLHSLLLSSDASSEQLQALVDRLPVDGYLDFYFRAVVLHHNASEAMLLSLLDEGRLLTELQHRTGPPELVRIISSRLCVDREQKDSD